MYDLIHEIHYEAAVVSLSHARLEKPQEELARLLIQSRKPILDLQVFDPPKLALIVGHKC